MPMLEIKQLKKIYKTRFEAGSVEALSDVSFSVEKGEFVAIMGESGSGKTTLLNIIAALDVPTAGSVLLNGASVFSLPDDKLASFRRTKLGFVFQEFNLLNTFSNADNILLPLVLAGGHSKSEMKAMLKSLGFSLGISDVLEKYPFEISGGQKQRVAIARALVAKPEILLADEPTGALDSRAAGELMKLFCAVNRGGQTTLMVTHSVAAASKAGRVLFIKDGQIYHQIYKGDDDDTSFYKKISQTLAVLVSGGAKNA